MTNLQRQQIDDLIADLMTQTQELHDVAKKQQKRNTRLEFIKGVLFTLAVGAIFCFFC